MNKKITTAIFVLGYPETTNKTLLGLLNDYGSSDVFRKIQEEKKIFSLEKWYFMRKFFEAEDVCRIIWRANAEFRIKWVTPKRKEYYVKNTENIREQIRVYYSRNKEKHIENEKPPEKNTEKR